jgi:hypothetical protein
MPAIPERNLTVHLGQDDRIHRMGPTRERSRLHPVHPVHPVPKKAFHPDPEVGSGFGVPHPNRTG